MCQRLDYFDIVFVDYLQEDVHHNDYGDNVARARTFRVGRK